MSAPDQVSDSPERLIGEVLERLERLEASQRALLVRLERSHARPAQCASALGVVAVGLSLIKGAPAGPS